MHRASLRPIRVAAPLAVAAVCGFFPRIGENSRQAVFDIVSDRCG